jgi:hypothetical protein
MVEIAASTPEAWAPTRSLANVRRDELAGALLVREGRSRPSAVSGTQTSVAVIVGSHVPRNRSGTTPTIVSGDPDMRAIDPIADGLAPNARRHSRSLMTMAVPAAP